MFKNFARALLKRELPISIKMADASAVNPPVVNSCISPDLFFKNVFDQITFVLEEINLEGCRAGLEVQDPAVIPSAKTGEVELLVRGNFTLEIRPDEPLKFKLQFKKPDPDLGVWMPGGYAQFVIKNSADCATWCQGYAGNSSNFKKVMPEIIRTLHTPVERVTSFTGFRLFPESASLKPDVQGLNGPGG